MLTMKQEKGGTVVLVLLISMLLSIMVLSLVGLYSQTSLVSRQAGSQEKAYTDADSLIRLTKRSMQEVAPQGLSAEGLHAIISGLQSGLVDLNTTTEFELRSDHPSNPSKIIATAEYGHGNAKRKQTIELGFSQLPQTDADLGTGGGGNGFGSGAGGTSQIGPDHPMMSILENPVMSRIPSGGYHGSIQPEERFKVCDEDYRPINDYEFIFVEDPDVIALYDEIYEQFVEDRVNDRPALREPIPTDSRVSKSNTEEIISQVGDEYDGIEIDGNVTFRRGSGSSDIIVGNSIEVTGNLDINPWGSMNSVTIEGNVHVGGNFKISSVPSFTVNGDLIVNGDFNANTIASFTVNGHVIIGGNVTMNAVPNIHIEGSFSVGGAPGQAGHLSISGSIQNFVVGTWFGDQIVTPQHLITKGTLTFSNGSQALKVTGDVSAHRFMMGPAIQNLHIGGSLIVYDGLKTQTGVNKWLIEKHISIHQGKLEIIRTTEFEILGNIYVNGVLDITGKIDHLKVNGSIYTTETVRMHTSTGSINILGDFMTNGDIIFHNPIGSHEVDEFFVGGALGALNDIRFHTVISVAAFGAFYAGNEAHLPGWTTIGRGSDDQGICITYSEPGSGGGNAGGEFNFEDIVIN